MLKKILLVGSCAFLIFAAYDTAKPKIFVIGDSTACKYTSSLYPLTGWAMVLQEYLNLDSIQVADSARSGCSSKSFYTEGRWTPVKNALKR
jgi:lysophospholipase L1-like esterase